MRRLLCVAAATALLGVVSGAANAATVIDVDSSPGFTLVTGSGSSVVVGTVIQTTALQYADNYFTFHLSPTAGNGSVTVDTLAGATFFPGETWEINDLTTSMVGVWSGAANDVPAAVVLAAGQEYAFALNSSAPPSGVGSSQSNLSITSTSAMGTPLPGTLALFAGGLGLLGFTGWRRRNKSQKGSRLSLA